MKDFLANLGVQTGNMSLKKAGGLTLPPELRDPKELDSNWFVDIGKYMIWKNSAQLLKEKGYIDLDEKWSKLTTVDINDMVSIIGESYSMTPKEIATLVMTFQGFKTKYLKPYNGACAYVGVAFVKSDKLTQPLAGIYSFGQVELKGKDKEIDGKKVEGKPYSSPKVSFMVCSFHDQILGASSDATAEIKSQKFAPFVSKELCDLFLGRIHKSQAESGSAEEPAEFSAKEDVFLISLGLRFQEKYHAIDGQLLDLWC